MRTWSQNSREHWLTLDSRLKTLTTRLRDEVMDISITYGHRTESEQNSLYYSDPPKTKVKWPHSKHNRWPSKAVDIQPYPYPRDKKVLWAALGYLAGHAARIAAEEGFRIRWGGDWDGDGDLTNQSFYDLFHLEILE